MENQTEKKEAIKEEKRKEKVKRINEQMIERSQMRKKKWIKEVQENPRFGESKIFLSVSYNKVYRFLYWEFVAEDIIVALV